MRKKMKNKVSIIIPVYNTEQYIERCAHSLFNQTFNGIEYIFVDDCTKDASMSCLQKVIDMYPDRVMDIKICTHNRNKGVAAARNTGLSAATGEYVIYCDSDDWIDATMISSMYNQIVSTESDIVWNDYYASFVDHDELVVQSFSENSLSCMKALLTERMHGALWNKLVRRSIYKENNLCFQEGLNICEDLRMVIQLFHFAKKVQYYPGAFYHYIQYNTNSVCSGGALHHKLDNMLDNCDGILTFIKEQHLDEKLFIETNILKLAAKQLLLLSLNKQDLKHWRVVYPEANRYIWKYTALPFHLRFIGWCISHQWGIIIDLWIFLKKIKNRK